MKQIYILFFFMAILSVSVAQNSDVLHTNVGKGISAIGGATASISIYTSPGRKGAKPELSIVYNSSAGETVMGTGWSLNGLSAITATGTNYHLDGAQEAATLTSSDKFVLDGERLILTNGLYGQPNSEYRTEHDKFINVKFNGTYFVIDTKDGSKLFYGSSNDSKIIPIGATLSLSWFLKKSFDVNGNYMEFVYESSNGQILLSEIKYGGYDCTINGTISCGETQETTYNKVAFEYSSSIGNLQKFVAGSILNNDKLLNKIICFTSGVKVREYSLNYAHDNVNNYLTQIQEKNGINETLPPVDINWSNDEVGFSKYICASSYNNFRHVGDFDGDGKKDLLIVDGELNPYENKFLGMGNRLKIYKIDETNNVVIANYLLPYNRISAIMVADVDSDGDDDIVFQILDNIVSSEETDDGGLLCNEFKKYYLTNMTFKYHLVQSKNTNRLDYAIFENFFPQRTVTNTQNMHLSSEDQFYKFLIVLPMLGDVDGDGLPDLIERECSGTRTSVETCPGGSIKITNVVPENESSLYLYLSTRKKLTLNDRFVSYFNMGKINFLPMDFNGNGKLDFMCRKVQTNKTEILELSANLTSLNHIYGDGTLGFPTQYHKFLKLGDFNGDLKTDLIYFTDGKWWIAYSTGISFVEYNATDLWFLHVFNPDFCGNGVNFEIGDFNGDGKSDIFERHTHQAPFDNTNHNGENTTHIYYSKGLGFYKQSFANSYLGVSNIVGDFNGDGKADIIFKREDRIIAGNFGSTEPGDVYCRTFPEKSKRVIKIQYSPIHSIGFDYQVLTQSLNYKRESATPTFSMAKLLNAPLYIVTQISSNTVGFPSEITIYHYKNLLYFTHGRGIIGFKDLAIVNVMPSGRNNTTIIGFQQNIELPYRLDLKYKHLYNNCTNLASPFSSVQNLVSTTENDFSQIKTTNNTIFSYNSNTIEVNNLTGVKKITCAEYDINGNVIHTVTTWGKSNSQTVYHTSSIDNKYAKFGTWLPSSPVLTRSTDKKDGIVAAYLADIEYIYNAKGQEIAKEKFKNNPHYYIKELTSYDKYGNVFYKALDSANNSSQNLFRKRTYVYQNGKFLKSEINALGHIKYLNYEPIYGNMLSVTDYDGQVSTMLYDNWGRLYQTNVPGNNRISVTRSLTTSYGAYSKVITMTSLGEEMVEYYDAKFRKIREEKNGFANKVMVKEWVYNADGQIIQESNCHDLQIPSSTKWNYFFYDEYGRHIVTKYQNTETTHTIDYNGLVKTEKFGGNKQREITLDEMGNVVKVKDNGGTLIYKYGAHKKIIETNANGSVISLDYNVQLNKIKLNDPNTGEILYDYNAFGELLAQKDASNNEFNMYYDDLGRLVKKFGMGKEYVYTYFNNSGSPTNNKLNTEELKVNGNLIHKKEYQYYNTHGKLMSVKETITNSPSSTTSYTYDGNLRVKQLNYPNISLVYNYGVGNDVVEMVDMQGNMLWSKNNTNNFGVTNEFTYGNGFTTSSTTDGDGLLTTILSQIPSGATALNIQYEFDFLSQNLKSRHYPLVYLQEDFTYDNNDRLTDITYFHQGVVQSAFDFKTYTYSNNGNILSINNGGIQDFTYGTAKPNALNKHKFDEDISLLNVPQASIDEHTYSFNNIGKLASINQGNLEYNLGYGLADERITTTLIDGGLETYTKRFINSSNMEVKNNIELTYLYAEGKAFAIHRKGQEGEDILYLHNDYQGSIMAISNQSGAVIETRSYDAWGRPRDPLSWDYQLNPFTAANITDRGYTFHEHLIEFSLINMNGRMYDPVVCRIISPDNFIQEPHNSQSYNRYSYCLNNPLKYEDPTGQMFESSGINPYYGSGSVGGYNYYYNNYTNGGMIGTISMLVSGPGGFGQFMGNYVFDKLGGYGTAIGSADFDVSLSAQQLQELASRSNIDLSSFKNFVRPNVDGNYVYKGRVPKLYFFTENNNINITFGKKELEVAKTFNSLAQSSGGCPNCLNPSTTGNNLLGLTYPGGNNPKSYNGQYNYSYVPTNLSEYPAIGHDRRYDNLKITGASGLFTDTRAIGADWRFVGEELSIAANPYLNPIDRASAGILGIGLGLSALPKTLFQLSSPFGYGQIMMWYNISNQGVNNAPTIHKH